MTDGQVFFGGLLAMFVFSGVTQVVGLHVWERHHSPARMVERMRKHGPLRVELRDFWAITWNPGRPAHPKNWLRGPAVGTYWLDDDEMVHLRWEPRDRQPVREWVGRVPEVPRRTTARRLMWVNLLYPLAGLVGFELGWRYAGPDRVTAGLWFALVGMFAVFLLLHLVFVALGALGLGNRKRTSVG